MLLNGILRERLVSKGFRFELMMIWIFSVQRQGAKATFSLWMCLTIPIKIRVNYMFMSGALIYLFSNEMGLIWQWCFMQISWGEKWSVTPSSLCRSTSIKTHYSLFKFSPTKISKSLVDSVFKAFKSPSTLSSTIKWEHMFYMFNFKPFDWHRTRTLIHISCSHSNAFSKYLSLSLISHSNWSGKFSPNFRNVENYNHGKSHRNKQLWY